MDNVNHPDHYTSGGIECIDAIRASLGDKDFADYCKGNIIKYLWRYRLKNGVEDLHKAQVYLRWMIEAEERTEKEAKEEEKKDGRTPEERWGERLWNVAANSVCQWCELPDYACLHGRCEELDRWLTYAEKKRMIRREEREDQPAPAPEKEAKSPAAAPKSRWEEGLEEIARLTVCTYCELPEGLCLLDNCNELNRWLTCMREVLGHADD